MPSFKIIGLLVLEKKIFKGFYHIWAWRPSWSCDLDHLYKLSFPLPKEAPHKIWLWLAKRFQRRRCLNIVDNDDNDNRRRSKGILQAHLVRLMWAKKQNWKKKAKINLSILIFFPTIYLATLKVYTKFEDFGSHRSREICDRIFYWREKKMDK